MNSTCILTAHAQHPKAGRNTQQDWLSATQSVHWSIVLQWSNSFPSFQHHNNTTTMWKQCENMTKREKYTSSKYRIPLKASTLELVNQGLTKKQCENSIISRNDNSDNCYWNEMSKVRHHFWMTSFLTISQRRYRRFHVTNRC